MYGPVRTVVWQGSAGDRRPYADQSSLWKAQIDYGSSPLVRDPQTGKYRRTRLFCQLIYQQQGEMGIRGILGVLSLMKKYGDAAVEDACATAIDLGVQEYRFVRRYLERSPHPQMFLRQIDPLIRQLTEYREELLEIVMRRRQCANTLVTSNGPVEDWGKLLGDIAAVTATLNRLLHHGHILKCGPWLEDQVADRRLGGPRAATSGRKGRPRWPPE